MKGAWNALPTSIGLSKGMNDMTIVQSLQMFEIVQYANMRKPGTSLAVAVYSHAAPSHVLGVF